MLRKIFMLACGMTILLNKGLFAQEGTVSLEEVFKSFCHFQPMALCQEQDAERNVSEKNGLIEIKKGQLTIQFARYNRGDNKSFYSFSYYRDTCCGAPLVKSACYMFENNQWKDITTEVMPALTFNDFYGPDVAPPQQYQQTVQYRYVLHKNNQVHVVIEPLGTKLDEKFIRIFERRKYAAVLTKWNSNSGRFEIQKWLK
jgi:hypothetical protein